MWLGILSGLYAVPALLGLLASIWQTVSALRRRQYLSAFGWLSLVALFLTGRWWVRLLRPAAADEPKPLRPDKRGTVIGHGGVRLEWEQFGPDDAPVLLLTHGWSLSHETWYYQKKALSDEFRVIVWDLRGTDRSQPPADRDYSFDAMTADLAAVFIAADAGRHSKGCILAGHSVGAMLLPLFAVSYPELMADVRGLALLGGTDLPMLETMRGRRVLTTMRGWFWEPLARLMAFAPAPFEAFVKLIYQLGCVHLALMVGTNCGQDSRGQNDLVAGHCARFSMRAAGLGALACFGYNTRALMPQVDVPVLVMTGDGDLNTPPDIQDALARRLPQAELVLIKHCGHLSLLECHAEVNAHLRKFARRCLGARDRGEEARITIPIPQQICLVEAAFSIKGRGLVVTTKEWQAEQSLSRGDWIELRSGTGERHQAQVKAIDSVRLSAGRGLDGTLGLCLIGISRDAVQAGDEIWSVGTAD